VIKGWLRYLVNTPLYREKGITVDEEFLRDVTTEEKFVDLKKNSNLDYQDEEEPYIELIDDDPQSTKELLLAKQHMMLWDEGRILAITPSMNRPVVSLGYDEHAEELSAAKTVVGSSLVEHRTK